MKFEDLTRVKDEEKKKPTLSKIPRDFYENTHQYIRELEVRDKSITKRHSPEGEMVQYELRGALSAIDTIFKRRTRKIIKMATARAFSKKPADITHDVENMTAREKDVYHQVLEAISTGRKGTIEPILGTDAESEIPQQASPETGDESSRTGFETPPGEEPEADDSPLMQEQTEPGLPEKDSGIPGTEEPGPELPIPEVEKIDKVEEAAHPDITTPAESEAEPPQETTPQAEEASAIDEGAPAESHPAPKNDLNKEYIVVRILKDIPTFIGADGRNYAPGAQDVAVLPKVNARALIKRKVAVQVEST